MIALLIHKIALLIHMIGILIHKISIFIHMNLAEFFADSKEKII
jgi:hypothetical protein